MKMHFTMVVAGEQSFEDKFKSALEGNPALHMELIKGFAQILMLGLRLEQSDNISIESFRAGKIPDSPPQPIEQSNEVKKSEEVLGCAPS